MDTNEIRKQLQTQLAELMRRHGRVESSLRRERTPLEGDSKEDAVVRANDDVLEALDAEGRGRLQQLHAALLRLDEGTYGLCARCGKAIAPARLAATPEITSCIACASAAETPRR